MAGEAKKCRRHVNRGDSRVSRFEECGRDAITVDGDGIPVCRMHHNSDVHRAANEKKWSENLERGRRIDAQARELSERLGIDVKPYYSVYVKPTGYTGAMIVPSEFLEAISERKCQECGHPLGACDGSFVAVSETWPGCPDCGHPAEDCHGKRGGSP